MNLFTFWERLEIRLTLFALACLGTDGAYASYERSFRNREEFWNAELLANYRSEKADRKLRRASRL